MNAGMYGMADGRGMAGRKLTSQLRSGTNYATAISVAGSLAGASGKVAAGSVTGSVRTRIFSVNGKGAVRWFAAGPTGSTPNITAFLVIDGVEVKSETRISAADGSGVGVCGICTSAAAWDYIPFDSSAEVFVTVSTTANVDYAYVVDLHQ
jgi:hypothetical protein